MEEALEASKQDSTSDPSSDGPSTRATRDTEPEGLRTPRAMHPVQDTQAGASGQHSHDVEMTTDDDLADLASTLSLTQTNHPLETSDPDDSPEDLAPRIANARSNIPSSSSLAVPRPIPGRAGGGGGRYDLSPGGQDVMTPRNDAGPFVLDGGAGARTGMPARRAVSTVTSLDAAANEVGLGHV